MIDFFSDLYKRLSCFFADFFLFGNIEKGYFYGQIWVEEDGILPIPFGFTPLMGWNVFSLFFFLRR